MKLSNLTVQIKLTLLVGAMVAAIAAVAAKGYVSIDNLAHEQAEVASTGHDALLGAQINQNVADLSRAEYEIAAEPSAEHLQQVIAAVTEQRKLLEERLAKARSHADTQQQLLLQAIDEQYRSYIARLEATLARVRQIGATVSIGDAQRSIYEEVKASRVVADRLQNATRAYLSYTDEKVDRIVAAARTEAIQAEVMMIVIAGAGILGGVALGYFLASFGIARPLSRSIENVSQLSKGNLAVDIFGVGRKDEIGQIAAALQVFKDNALNAQRLEAEQKSAQEKQLARAKAIEAYIAKFDTGVAGVLQMVSSSSTELQSTAQAMSTTAEETQRQATAVAAASEQASTNVQTVAAAAEELSSSIAEITRQVAESAKIARDATDEAAQTDVQIKSLAEAAQKIGDVVKLIADIASQTNLLALNATIEAARAGEAGKGFAVVASEVKSLANQTAKATEEISAKIAEMQTATGQSVQAIGMITGTIGRINEIATTIASAVEEQGAATQEIARNVQQASAGTAEVSSNIGGVTQAASDTGAAANQVLGASGELSKQSETLRRQVDTFLANIRAA